MDNFTPPERALIFHIGNTLAQGDEQYVVKNTGLDGEVRALRRLGKEKIMEITGVQDNDAVKELMNTLQSYGILTIERPVVTNGGSVYFVVQLTDAGRQAYEFIRKAAEEELAIQELKDEPYPAGKFTPEDFPGLFEKEK